MSTSLKLERNDATGVFTLWLDQPGKPVVVLDSRLLREIDAALLEIEAGRPSGVILRSASDRVFVAGADLNEIGSLDDVGLDAYLAFGQGVFDRIEALQCPTVAVISGDALGGGLEICLACSARIAVKPTGRTYQIGLPEAKLGILPGWGGTQRLAAITEPGAAIGRTATGRTMTPAQALRLGVVDAVVEAERLQEAAEAMIAGGVPKRARRIQERSAPVASSLARMRRVRTRPVRRLPAAQRVLDAVEIGLSEGYEAGLAAERRFLVELRATPESTGMLEAFFARGSVVRSEMKRLAGEARPATTVAVYGQTPAAERLAKGLSKKATVQRIGPETTACEAEVFLVAASDDRVEQVAALRAVSAYASEEAVIASVHPVLGMAEVAASVANAERLVGFVPAEPAGSAAIEVIRGEFTSDGAVGAALTLVKALGGVPIVQREGGPSLLTRLFGAVAMAALEKARSTGDAAAVDRAMRQEGFSQGAIAVLRRLGGRRCLELVGRGAEWPEVEHILYNAAETGQTGPAEADRGRRATGGGRRSSGDAVGSLCAVLRDAGSQAMAEGVVLSGSTVQHAAVFGLGLGAWVSLGLEG